MRTAGVTVFTPSRWWMSRPAGAKLKRCMDVVTLRSEMDLRTFSAACPFQFGNCIQCAFAAFLERQSPHVEHLPFPPLSYLSRKTITVWCGHTSVTGVLTAWNICTSCASCAPLCGCIKISSSRSCAPSKNPPGRTALSASLRHPHTPL